MNDSLVFNIKYETVEFLFLGNSLTYTDVPEEEPDKRKRGLTSTSVENDYVHKLVSAYAQKNKVNVKFSAVNIADFERSFVDNPFKFSRLRNTHVKSPDVVIFQIGENVASNEIMENGQLFFERYSELINNFKNSTRIVCLPFWPHREKINIITDVAVSTNSRICDLSHLGCGLDQENLARNYRKYKKPGVGVHPGDIGMKRIAENLLCVLSE